jgi:hypothetical protein
MQQLEIGPVEANRRLSRSSFLRKAPTMPHHTIEEVSAGG